MKPVKPVRSTKPYNIIAALVFLFGIGMFAYMGVYDWLPALCIVTGASIIIRQILMGFHIDTLVALIIFGGAFLSSFMTLFARVFLPALLMLGAVYFIIRQFISFHDKLVVKTQDVHIERINDQPEAEEAKND